jgi:hypothetical protein
MTIYLITNEHLLGNAIFHHRADADKALAFQLPGETLILWSRETDAPKNCDACGTILWTTVGGVKRVMCPYHGEWAETAATVERPDYDRCNCSPAEDEPSQSCPEHARLQS